MVRSLVFTVIVLCCGIAVAQQSVLVPQQQAPTPAQVPEQIQVPVPAQPQQLPAQQLPVQQLPPPVLAQAPYMVAPMGPRPVWLIKKKFFGRGYRAKPGWINTGCRPAPYRAPCCQPPVVQPIVQPVVVRVIVPVRIPQPVITYQPQQAVIYRPVITWQ